MWVYVVTNFSRYRNLGREAQKSFESSIQKDGFFKLHNNLSVRYCTTSVNAAVHKERVKKLIPAYGCDVSILLVPDSQESNVHHHLKRHRKASPIYSKPDMVEFF